MSDELRPCPCCDSENVGPIFVNEGHLFESVAAACHDCGIQTKFGKSFPKSRETWNVRPSDRTCETKQSNGEILENVE